MQRVTTVDAPPAEQRDDDAGQRTAQTFAITLEPDGGSVQPTALPPLLTVRLLA